MLINDIIIDGVILKGSRDKSDGFKLFEKVYNLDTSKTIPIDLPVFNFYYMDKSRRVYSKSCSTEVLSIHDTTFTKYIEIMKQYKYIFIYDTFYVENGLYRLDNDIFRYNVCNINKFYYREEKLKRILQ